MQATFQKYVDSLVWKQVYLPENVSVADLDNICEQAFELGCKSLVLRRQGLPEQSVSKLVLPTQSEMTSELIEQDTEAKPHIVRPSKPIKLVEETPPLDISMMRKGKGLVQSYPVNASEAPVNRLPAKAATAVPSQAKLSFTSSTGQYQVEIHENGAELSIQIKPLS